MQELFKLDFSNVPSTEKPKKGFYLEPKLMTVEMSEMPEFEARFTNYHFE